MEKGINQFVICGRVGKDPTIKHKPEGYVISTVRICTEKTYTDKGSGDLISDQNWHTINFIGKLAQVVARSVRSGDLVYTRGELKERDVFEPRAGMKLPTKILAADYFQILVRNPRWKDERRASSIVPDDEGPEKDDLRDASG